jgi:hypothetical protein
MLMLIFIEKISKRAIHEFKHFDSSLETRDFAIEVTGLPPKKQYKSESILKALLFQYFTEIVENQP